MHKHRKHTPSHESACMCPGERAYSAFLKRAIIGLSPAGFFLTIILFALFYSWFYYTDIPGVENHNGVILSKQYLIALGISFVHLFAAYYVLGMVFAWVCFALLLHRSWLAFKRVGIFLSSYIYVLLVMAFMGIDVLLKKVDLLDGKTALPAYFIKESIWAIFAYKAARLIFHTKRGRSLIFFVCLPILFTFLESSNNDTWSFAKKILYH